MRRKSVRSAMAAAVVLSCLLVASTALAHRVNVFAYVEGDMVHVECSYSKSDRVRFGEIEVKNPATGQVYLTGKTDAQGNFAFKIPEAARKAKADLQIVLKAGEGHQNDWTVEAKEYLATDPVDTPVSSTDQTPIATTAKTAAPAAAATAQAPQAQPQLAPGLTPQQLTALVEAVVEKKIAPVRKILLDEKEKGPGITEIAGGIGYLVGIAGLLAYARSRGKRSGS